MGQNFVSCDRGQAMLMPPSLLDWVPDDHLVWTVLGAVEQMDLSGIYGTYRANGQGRAAYDPAMLVALLLYSYSRGNRSSRGIERACREDVAVKVITALRVPDHSTIAEFRRRHETAIGELFVGVLALCREAGLVNVGVIAVDGTKMRANASRDATRHYHSIVSEILEEAERLDREEDELFGDGRGDELPEQLRSRESRRAALLEAKRKLDQSSDADDHDHRDHDDGDDSGGGGLGFEAAQLTPSAEGRRGWLREGRWQLDRQREREARPIPRSRSERLLEAKRRLEQNLQAEIAANRAYETYRAGGRMKDGRRFGRPPDPYVPPAEPPGWINVTDPDARIMRTTGQPAIQGYNAQAAVTEQQIIVAAEITIESPDYGHLGPVVTAALRELEAAGVTDRPETIVADPGYWHAKQMENIVDLGIQVVVPPDAKLRPEPRPGWDKGLYAFMRRVVASEAGQAVYKIRQGSIEPVFGQTKYNRRFDCFQRRGRAAARSEWRLIAATHNLMKLHNHWIQPATS